MKRWIRFVLVMGLLLAFMNMLITYSYVADMNRQELHYDADDYFLMVDQEHHIMGFYNGCTPLKHMGCSQKMPEGVYDAQIIYGGGILLEDGDFTIYIPLRGRALAWVEKNYASGHPALVY